MRDWLLEHQGSLVFYLWLGVFGLIAISESFWPRRALGTAAAARWASNIGLTTLNMLVGRFFLPVTGIAAALWAEQRGWGLLNELPVPIWLACVATVFAIDLGNYAVHRLFHAVPLLWRCHKIHHCDLDVDCSTAIRHHPFEYLLVSGVSLALIVLIGASPVALIAFGVVDLLLSLFNHGNLSIPQSIDRVLRRFVVTPDMHRIHHSALQSEGNRNFGNMLPWWDRLFGTYQSAPAHDHKRMDLGLAEARAPDDVTLLKLLALPFRSPRAVASA